MISSHAIMVTITIMIKVPSTTEKLPIIEPFYSVLTDSIQFHMYKREKRQYKSSYELNDNNNNSMSKY